MSGGEGIRRVLPLERADAGDGSFHRQDSVFRDWVTADGSSGFPAEPGRYHLYVSRACPWAHRTIIARRLKGLEGVIGMSVVDPIRDERGWAFTGGAFTDAINGWDFLAEAYTATDPAYEGRVSVPVLWDTATGRIVSNESADVLRMLGSAWDAWAERPEVDLYPEPLRAEIDALNARLYDEVNNAVYKAGFATRQEVYEAEVRQLFATLAELDERLAGRRFLFGDAPVETDWRLFTTLVRFDAVYAVHFKCSARRIVEFGHLWPYLRDLHAWPGVAETVDLDQIRAHYYGTHPSINPNGIVAVPPAADLGAPHDREALSRRAETASGSGPGTATTTRNPVRSS